jgi:hypothetical protein
MKCKNFILKQLYYSNYDHRWHADDKYTYKVLGVGMLSDGAIGVELVRTGATPFIFRFTNKTNGLWRIGHKDYDIRSDEVLYEFYKDVQNGLTENILEEL